LTAAHRIKPTSHRCRSAWQPNPGRAPLIDAEILFRQPGPAQNAQARTFRKENGHRPRVFCASLADVFDNQIDTSWRDDLFALIRECNKLDWLVLTKRPENIEKMLPPDWDDGYSNVWLGTTAEDQTRFDARWKRLKKIPAVVRFISYEPALGPVRLPSGRSLPDWLISGGESGAGARPLKPQWVRDVIADCRRFGVAPFHKQWGSYQGNTNHRVTAKADVMKPPCAPNSITVFMSRSNRWSELTRTRVVTVTGQPFENDTSTLPQSRPLDGQLRLLDPRLRAWSAGSRRYQGGRHGIETRHFASINRAWSCGGYKPCCS
jgi:protein gp37